MLHDQHPSIRQIDPRAIVIMVVPHFPRIVSVGCRGVVCTDTLHRAGEKLGGQKFHGRRVAFLVFCIDINALMPGNLGRVQYRSQRKLGVVAVVATSFLGQSIYPLDRIGPKLVRIAAVASNRLRGPAI